MTTVDKETLKTTLDITSKVKPLTTIPFGLPDGFKDTPLQAQQSRDMAIDMLKQAGYESMAERLAECCADMTSVYPILVLISAYMEVYPYVYKGEKNEDHPALIYIANNPKPSKNGKDSMKFRVGGKWFREMLPAQQEARRLAPQFAPIFLIKDTDGSLAYIVSTDEQKSFRNLSSASSYAFSVANEMTPEERAEEQIKMMPQSAGFTP